MNKTKTISWVVGGIMALGASYYGVQKLSPSSSSAPSINISTANSHAVEIIQGVNAVDIYYLKKPTAARERNLLDATYSSLARQSGFTDFIYPVVGATSRYAHQQSGVGYVGHQKDFPSYSDYAAYGGGVLVAAWQTNFSSNQIAFAKNIGATNSVTLNILNGNFAEHSAMLAAYNPKVIFLGAELMSYMSAKAYIDSCNKIIPFIRTNYPKAIIIANGTVLRRENPQSIKWNDSISVLPVDGFNNYNHSGDVEGYTANQDSNIIRINDYYNREVYYEDSIFIATYTKKNPNAKEALGEWLVEDIRGNTLYVSRTVTGIYALFSAFQSYTNRPILNYTAWMGYYNLVDDNNSPDPNYTALSYLNKSIAPNQKVTSVTFTNLNGVDGYTSTDGTTTTLCLKNTSTSTYTLNSVTVDGQRKSGTFNQRRWYASNWYGALKVDSVQSTVLTILPYSSEYVTLK